jgi:hypothetical protein
VSFVRKFVLPAVAALLLATASPAAAADWTVTPGGNFVAGGGDVSFFFEETGVEWYCSSLELQGSARAGTGGNPVAVLPETPGAVFGGCTGPFGIVPEYTQVGDWTMHADSYDPGTDTVTGTIHDVAFDWVWAACNATFSGSLNYRYSNSYGQLEILPGPTLTEIFVDPQNDCLGIVDGTETASLENTSTVVPPQQVVPS